MKLPLPPPHNTIGNSIGNSIGNCMNKWHLQKIEVALYMNEHNFIKGFPCLLNTLGTFLDWSPTIKPFSNIHKNMSVAQKTPGVRPGVHYKICFWDFGCLQNSNAYACEKIGTFMCMLYM